MSEIKNGMRVRIKTAPTQAQVEMDEQSAHSSGWHLGAGRGMQHMAGAVGVTLNVDDEGDCMVDVAGQGTFWWAVSNLEIVE